MTLTEVPDKASGSVFSETNWDTHIRDNINDLIGRSGGNLLTNGGFEVWQRGAGPFVAGSIYTADRWYQDTSANASTTQESSTVDGASRYSLRCVVTSFDSAAFTQTIEDFYHLRGKTVTFSCRINQSVAAGATIRITDSSGTTTSATSATTGSWVTLTVTRTIGAAVTFVNARIVITANGTYYCDNAMLVIGPTAATFVPLHPQEDLARCQRYYEVHGGVNNAMGLNAYQAAGANFGQIVQFAVPKYGIPTVTKNGTWGVVNCGQPAISAPTRDGYTIYATATALGTCSFGNNSSDDTVTAESNP